MTSLGFRAIRDTLSHDPASQERVMGTFLFSLALADVRFFFDSYLDNVDEGKRILGDSVNLFRSLICSDGP